MSIGEKIKEYRISMGLSQEELGALIGVKKAAVNKYETGRVVNLKRSTIKKLSDVFNISPIELMGWDSLNDDILEHSHASVNSLAKEISIEDQLQTVLQQDDYINGFEFSQEQLQKILEYARFIRSQEA